MEGVPKPPLRPRRLLERPRLIRSLDRSRARVRMLVAGPGYGKTTLTEQWAAGDQRVAWVRSRRSSADVAVLARQMAAAGAEIIPGCDRRLLERLNVTQDPAGELEVLVDLLSRDFREWPDDAWIVIDDYQFLRESVAAEAFVEGMLQRSPLQVLIATRDRPSWVSPRDILYGDVLEIGQGVLAMSEEEVSAMLAGVRDEMTSGLLALAGGWPAVIGLASLTTSDVPLPEENLDIPERLYEFFADEVYRGLEPDVRSGLGLLATAPSLDRELAAELLGAERAERICAEALTLGVMEERDGRLELHPLAAAFLEERARRTGSTTVSEALLRALDVYKGRREWDAAFEVLNRSGMPGLARLEDLFEEALDDLLNTARLATLASWVARAASKGIDLAIVQVSSAEVDLRHGLHMAAESAGVRAAATAEGSSQTRFRALEVAARAAHVGSREEVALSLYRSAEDAAPDERCYRKAIWGQVMCAGALELPEAHELMSSIRDSPHGHEPTELVRLADRQLSLGFRFGYVRHLRDARRVSELVATVDDPFVRCSFRSIFSWALILGCSYREAHEQASLLLEDATEFRVDVAISHAQAMMGYSAAGLRDFASAEHQLSLAADSARAVNDPFAEQNAYALLIRVLLQQGRAAEACAIEPPDLTEAVKSMRGEVMGSRALALATLGRLDEAIVLAEQAVSLTQGIEARVLEPAVRVVVALKTRASNLLDLAETLVSTAFDSAAIDLLVCAYRANPELLTTLLLDRACSERTVFAITRSGDHDLATGLGLEAVGTFDPRSRLSAREREVYDLVCAGLSNREIAAKLFITEATVKVHLHHVFDKVGIRSRTALAMNALHERVRQATPAIDDTDTATMPLS